jgi:DNA-binding NarL/FixJ family response regulator
MIRILVADDHAIVRRGLRQLFALTRALRVVAEARDGEETLAHVRDTEFDVLVLDMTVPAPAGPELIEAVRALRPTLPVVMLSMHSEVQLVAAALRAGATAYVTKGSEPEVLFEAIHQAWRGVRYLDPALLEAGGVPLDTTPGANEGCLSERELQVLALIADGLNLTEIGARLHLSPKTVSTYKMRMMGKLELDSNLELIRFALDRRASGKL